MARRIGILAAAAVLAFMSARSPAEARGPNCREYPGVRSQVRCVFYVNGMLWAWKAGIVQNIVERESGWIPWAHNPRGYFGLFQVWERWFSWPHYLVGRYGRWDDPVSNAAMAVYIYREQGWGAWGISGRPPNQETTVPEPLEVEG